MNATMVYLRHIVKRMRNVVQAAAEGIAKPADQLYAPNKKRELLAFPKTLL